MNRLTLFWQIAGACSIWLGFPNDFTMLPCLVLAWPVSLAVLGQNALSARTAFRQGWFATFAGSCAAMYWLAFPIHNVAGLPWIAAFACAFFVAGVLATASGFFTIAAFALRTAPTISFAMLLGLSWTSLESSYATIFGCPWLTLTGALAPWPIFVQSADVVGAFGASGLWVFCTSFLARLRPHFLLKQLPACLGTICSLSLLLLYGIWCMAEKPLESQTTGADSLQVLFVDGNIDQNQKWLPAFQRQTLEAYLKLTEKAGTANHEKTGIIIWPETAMPFFWGTNQIFDELIRSVARINGCALLFGAPGLDEHDIPASYNSREPAIFNRAVLIAPDGSEKGHYDKEHLVPFGEYMPEFFKFNFLSGLLQEVGIYAPGRDASPLRHASLALGMLICYEGIFPWLAQDRIAKGANILVDISNDGWFSKTPAASQHLYLTCLRAVEQNRWILRGTNSGISACIDNRGRIISSSQPGKAQTLAASARLCTKLSPYHCWNHRLIWACALPTLLFAFAWWHLAKTKRKETHE